MELLSQTFSLFSLFVPTATMVLEEIRYVLEDIERLEQAIVDRLVDEPTQIRDRLNREHEIDQLLTQMQSQSAEAEKLYADARGPRAEETRLVGATGDPLDFFYQELHKALEHHARYPHEPIDQPEQRYRPRRPLDPSEVQPTLVDTIFSGEEGFGRFFDLNVNYEQYINLPNVKRISYLQYLEVFDNFTPGTAGGIKRSDKLTDEYFRYTGDLADYLESFMRKTRPLENLEKVFSGFSDDFEKLWEKGELPNWKEEKAGAAGDDTADGDQPMLSSPAAIWCVECEKEFTNPNVYKGHLTGRKHLKAAERRAARRAAGEDEGGNGSGVASLRLKERAIATREYRVQRLVAAMSSEKEDTRVNVERRQGMTERERQQELENLYNMSTQPAQGMELDNKEEEDGDEKIYNPLVSISAFRDDANPLLIML